MKVGFAGLGNMGGGMARNVLQAGFELLVYNRTRSKAEALAGAEEPKYRENVTRPPIRRATAPRTGRS